MTLFIKIQNKGEIDEKAFRLLGASTKREDDSKIGFFGSGNKYAIALLLRKNIFFKVYSGTTEIVFGKKPVDFGGRQYEVITINGAETSLTTEMGPDWETWFAIREFYCNAIDEGEAVLTVEDKTEPAEGKTTIYIEKTAELSEFFANVERFMLAGKRKEVATVMTQYGKVTALETLGNEFICYRKGIRVNEVNETPALYRYDFEKIEINESRRYKYGFQVGERIASFFASSYNKDIIKRYLTSWAGRSEAGIEWQYADPLSLTWHELLGGERIYPDGIAKIAGDMEGKANSYIVPDKLAEKIAKEIPTAHVVGVSKGEKYQELDATTEELSSIQKAVTTLSRIGYPINCKVVVAKFYQKDVIASYDAEREQIVLARQYMNQSAEDLENTLLEEYFHSQGQVDGNRSFVTFLITEIIRAKKQRHLPIDTPVSAC